jgi:hypothetical protein
MKIRRLQTLSIASLGVASLLIAQASQAGAQTRTLRFDGALSTAADPEDVTVRPTTPTHIDATDYSPSGLDLGRDGYWFFNFAASANTGSAPEADEREALPSWITVDKTSTDPLDRTLSNGETVIHSSSGGQNDWAMLTLPSSETGVSGAVIAAGSNDDSVNVITNMFLGADTPEHFLMHVVVDNTNGEHDTDNRLKMRPIVNETPNSRDLRLRDLENINGIPDVYTFQFNYFGDGDELRVQIRNNSGFETASIAGVMFDVVPEPTSAVLLILGSIGLISRRRRR